MISTYYPVTESDRSHVAVCRRRSFHEYGRPGAFVWSYIPALPLPEGSVDVVFCEVVLRHTVSTAEAPKLEPCRSRCSTSTRSKGQSMSSQTREFTDDCIHARLAPMTPEEAWVAVLPLTNLGKALDDVGVEVEIPEETGLLGIRVERIDIQRLFY